MKWDWQIIHTVSKYLFYYRDGSMNIQNFSDLHFDINDDCETFFEKRYFLENNAISPETDVIVIAGDTYNDGFSTVDWIHDVLSKRILPHQHIIYIFGNHEFYNRDMKSCYEYAIARETNPQVTFLHYGSSVVIDNVLFVGDVLWTDLKYGDNEPLNHMLISRYMNDYKCIVKEKRSTNFITTTETVELHNLHLASIISKCREHTGDIVVITHHSPTGLSIDQKYIGKRSNCGYVSDILYNRPDLDDVFDKIKVWIHGHVHDTVDVDVLGIRVVANPFGYMKWFGGFLENDTFRFTKVINV